MRNKFGLEMGYTVTFTVTGAIGIARRSLATLCFRMRISQSTDINVFALKRVPGARFLIRTQHSVKRRFDLVQTSNEAGQSVPNRGSIQVQHKAMGEHVRGR